MTDVPPKTTEDSAASDFAREVDQRAKRKLHARRQHPRSAWFGLGMFGLVGWSVAVPALLGIALGVWIDKRWPSQVSWTLTFLMIGVGLGCLNAWYWIKHERPDESK